MAVEVNRLRNLPWHAAAWSRLQALRGRNHHAILLYGPAGIGKKGLALDFAAALLCESPQADGRACGRCTSCMLTETRNHPDLRIVVPDTLGWLRPEAIEEDGAADEAASEEDGTGRISREIRIDSVRALAALVGLASHRGGHRVIVLAPAEALNGSSANALLKILEEPPTRTQFILTTDRIDHVLSTIVSRCALLRVMPPAPEVALAWLQAQRVAEAERALAEAGGAPLAALGGDEATTLSDGARRVLFEALAAGPRLRATAVGARLPRALPLTDAIALFQRWAWDLLALRLAQRVRYHPHYRDVLARLAASSTDAALLRWIDALKRARASAEHPLNARLTIEALLLEYVDCLRASGATRVA